MRVLEKRALLVAQVKGALQLGRLARALSAKECACRIGRDDRAGFGREKVARVLRRKHERTVVFANSTRQADNEPPDGGVVK